jgi:hypothetical protein
VLVAFSLSAPQSQDVIEKLQTALEHLPGKTPVQLIAVTSYAAMNGEDEKTDAVFKTLEAFRTMLPPAVSVMIIPDTELRAFAVDAFPAAIVIDAIGRIAI